MHRLAPWLTWALLALLAASGAGAAVAAGTAESARAGAAAAPLGQGSDVLPAARATTWFLTTQQADVPSHGLAGVLLLGPTMSGTGGQTTFSSAPSLPVPVPGAPEPVESVTWYWPEPMAYDTQIVQDAIVVLYLDASLQVTARARAELRALGPDGGAVTLAAADESIALGDPQQPETRIALPVQAAAPAGAVVSLTIRLTDLGLATVLSYNTDAAPSRIDDLRLRPLDSDEDGVPDSLERLGGTDPNDAREPGDGAFDADGDGLPDEAEARLGADPFDRDSDGDGWSDGAEVQVGTDPLDGAQRPGDADDDGLHDAFEESALSSPTDADSDGDGLSDCLEDPDTDNATNCQEQEWGTDPLVADSDGDGVLDGDEMALGTDPTTHRSPPGGPAREVAEVALATVFLGAAAALGYVGLARRHRL